MSKYTLLSIFLAILGLSLQASAATGVAGRNSLDLRTSQYVSSRQNFYPADASANLSSIGVSIDTHGRWRKLEGRVFLSNEYSSAERWNHLNVYELYGMARISSESAFYFGRKLERWNEWEDDWNQGVFQPRYMQNKLRPERAGLFGVFLESKSKPVSMTFAFLPVFLPEFGPRFYTSEGKFVSGNPWFMPPPAKFVLTNGEGDIRYSLRQPDTADVALNPGIAGKIEWRYDRTLTRFAAAHKPIPQVLLGFPSYNRMVITPTSDYMSVEVNARVLYHQLLSVDHVRGLGSWTLQGSLTHEVPDSDRGPEDWTSQQARPAWIFALMASRPLEQEGPYAARLKLGALKVDGGDARARGEFAGQKALFERRYQFLEAYQVGLSRPWRGLFRNPLETEIRFLYDRMQNGGVLSLSSGINLSRQWRADLQVDFLGLFGSDAQVNDGFLALYRANDRVGLGMSYVF